MRKTSIAATALIAALALAGCSNTAPTAQPESGGAEMSSGARAVPSAMPTPVQSATAEHAGKATPVSVAPNQVKASASAAGRPEAAFDENCQVWEMPDPKTEAQEWANKLGAEWLETHAGAGCPDAVAYPFYFVESWENPSAGVLQVNVESAIDAIDFNPDATNLAWIARDTMCSLYEDEPDLSKVTAVTENGSRQETYTRNDYSSDPGRCN